MERDREGKGSIFAEELKTKLRFGISAKQLAFPVKRDTVQHKFLENLAVWAEQVRHYRFAENIQQQDFMEEDVRSDPPDPESVVTLFDHGERSFEGFREAVISDFGYPIEYIEVGELKSNRKKPEPPSFPFPLKTYLSELKVKEADLDDITDEGRQSLPICVTRRSLVTSDPD